MLRALLVGAVFVVLGSSCNNTRCGDLCNPNKPGECAPPFKCVSPGRCLIESDAGPSACQ